MLVDNDGRLPERMLTLASKASIWSESSGLHLREGERGAGGDLAKRVETTGVAFREDIEDREN